MAAHLLIERDAPVRASLHPYAGAEEVEDGQIRVHVCKFVFTANLCGGPPTPKSREDETQMRRQINSISIPACRQQLREPFSSSAALLKLYRGNGRA